MKFKESPLKPYLDNLEAQNKLVGQARAEYLMLEAERKHLEATITSEAPGKSYAEKLMNAQKTVMWLAFHKKIARAESVYEFQKFKLSILDKAWQSEYLILKLDAPLIKKQE